MRLQLDYRIYKRSLKKAVRFGDSWIDERDGIIVRLSDKDGRIGYGEIAPIENFGSESARKAERLLKNQRGVIYPEQIWKLENNNCPCTFYALHSALHQLQDPTPNSSTTPRSFAKLIQNDILHKEECIAACMAEYQVIKAKIGDDDYSIDQEHKRIKKLLDWAKPRGIKIRFDANEKLSVDNCKRWLEFLEPYSPIIEFVEQPIDRWLLEELVHITNNFNIKIALDESLAILNGHEQFAEKDKFLFVIKPSLGDLFTAQKLRIEPDQIILSSVFETAIGFSKLLNLPYKKWIPGLDTQTVFNDDLSYPQNKNEFYPRQIEDERLWKLLK